MAQPYWGGPARREETPKVPDPAQTPAPYVDPNQYTPGPMEQQAMSYWQQQTQQPLMTPQQQQQYQNIYAAGLAPEAQARLQEGLGQYARLGQVGAGQGFVGQTMAGYEGALRQGMAQNKIQMAQMEAQNRMGLASMGLSAAPAFASAGLQRQMAEYGQLMDAQSKDYYDYQNQQDEAYRRKLMELYGVNQGGLGYNAGPTTRTPAGGYYG